MNDTICAISTPFGVGGLAVLRISGSRAVSLVSPFVGKTVKGQRLKVKGELNAALTLNPLPFTLNPNHAHVCVFHDNGDIIDEIVVTYYKSPNSYTGEDVVEIGCHGSSYVQQKILQLLIAGGCRLANAGEFTQRAFLNGKMDLSQAEAVADLIHAQSESSHRLAIEQLRGGFSEKIKQLRQELIDFAALMELELDFSEEDVEFADRAKLLALLHNIRLEIQTLSDSFQMGNALKNGIPVAIAGEPNVGKSTLLNALLNEEKAIVSDIPGTTRDTIEDTLNIHGVLFRFIDTAGIRESSDTIENLGIERTRRAILAAQVVIIVRDVSTPSSLLKDRHSEPFDLAQDKLRRGIPSLQGDVSTEFILSKVEGLDMTVKQATDYGDLRGKHVINVINKIDLTGTDCKSAPAAGDDTILISAKNHIGIEKIVEKLLEFAHNQQVADRTLVSNLRHYEALNRALAFVENSENALQSGVPTDLVAIDIRGALHHLGEITGEISTEDVLGAVFSRFCIGK